LVNAAHGRRTIEPASADSLAAGEPVVIEFRVLGPFEVVEGGRAVALGPPRQQQLLAVLLLHRGEVVSADRLIDALWGERPPPSAVKIVQGYVSGLRKALGDGLLVTQGRGYLLQVLPDQLDVSRFESLVAEGRFALAEGASQTAAERLREALAVWRGPALSEFAYERFAQGEIARLEEMRLSALEDQIDADLALGRHTELVAELEELVREHPLRERLLRQLMLALYRAGRQADALERYRQARGKLSAELGIEPGPALKKLERAILLHDPELELASPESGRRPAVAARQVRRGGALIGVGGALFLAVVAGAAALLASSGTSVVRIAPKSVAVIDTRSNQVVGAVPVGSRPGAIAFGSSSLWVANQDDQTISRIDPRSLRTLHVFAVADSPSAIAPSRGEIWVSASDLNPSIRNVSVRRIDPEFDELGPPIRLKSVDQPGPDGLAAQGNSVWVSPSSGLLTRLDAATGRIVQQLDPNATPGEIAAGYGALWGTDTWAGDVIRVDPTGVVTPIAVGNGPRGVAVGGGGVWVADALDNAVVRIDPTTRAVTATIGVGRSPAGVAVGAGSIWVANAGDGTVTRIDPRTDRVLATIAVGGSPQAIAVAAGRAWATIDARSGPPASLASGGGTLRVESSIDVDSMDPAIAFQFLSSELLWETCAQLVNYPDESGAAGSRPIPEVAQSLPARSDGGRTYTFTIRPGFRFSPPSNQPVTAETFKDSIERTLNPKTRSPAASLLADVVGARAYMTGKAHHISGIVANGDALTIRLLAPAPNFLSRLAFPSFCAVPSNTPIDPNGVRMIPAAGPYYVASYAPGQGVVLVRNPNYHGSRPRHFERIELVVGIPPQRAVADVEAGRAEYTDIGRWGGVRGVTLTALVSRLAARYGSARPGPAGERPQYSVNPLLWEDFIFLNTHRPLFSDVRTRLAANYAVDRRALAALGGFSQPGPDRLTDHYLPPGIAGFRNVRLYPSTPDLAKARALMHPGRRTAVLYTCNVSPCAEQPQIVKTDLAAIGLEVRIQTFPSDNLFARLIRPNEPFDLAMASWAADYPDPEGVLNRIFAASSNYPTLDDPTYQHRLAAAARLSGPERYLTYGKLDVDLARNVAPLIAYGTHTSSDFFAARIGCETYNPWYGMDLGALCLRPTS
jgi:YVTN family beta-propeller protein